MFISYAHDDAIFVERLGDALGRSGVPVWYDREPNTGLASGQRWDQQLRQRVDCCSALVVVMSPAAAASPWVRLEAGRALDRGRPVCPVLYDGRAFPELRDLQYSSVRSGQILPSGRFVDDLRQLVAAPVPPTTQTGEVVGRWPGHHPHFVGRQHLLLDLETDLYWGSSVAVEALQGTGGVGKTQLASEYVHRRRADYDLVMWIDAEQVELIPDQLSSLADLLGTRKTTDVLQKAEAVVDALGRSDLRWLLVFDNAYKPDDLLTWLPRTGAGHVIVTSRQTGWDALGAKIDVDMMESAEAITLLRHRVTLDNATATEIVEQLGRLPLAVEQAAAYLAATGTPSGDYLGLLRTRGEELLDRGYVLGYEHTVATVWDVSQASLHAASPEGEQLLRLCAYLGPEPIPIEMFTGQRDLLPSPLADVARDELRFIDTIGALVERSLARRTIEGVVVHRLLSAVVRRRLTHSDGQEAVGLVIDLVRATFPDETWEVRTWPECESLLPHLLTAARHAVRLAVSGSTTGWLLDRASTYLRKRGQYHAAKPIAERALAAMSGVSEESLDTAWCHNNLGLVLHALRDLDQAQAQFEKAIQISTSTGGPDDLDTTIWRSNLGRVLRDRGDLVGARIELERALRISERALAPNDPTIGVRRGALGPVLRLLGDLAGAKEQLEQALRIGESALGPDHPSVAVRRSGLGYVLHEMGDLSAAREEFEEALRIYANALGADHPRVAAVHSGLAAVLVELGRLENAQRHYDDAIRIGEAAYGTADARVRGWRRSLERLTEVPPARSPDG